MSIMSTACQHPPTARYWDTDEERCRVCTSSISFPPHPPTSVDEKDRRKGGNHRVYEVGPPASLRCSCCGLSLTPDSFSTDNSPKARNRAYRASTCRRCQASKVRARRELNPEGYRERDRLRSAGRQAGLTPAQRETARLRRVESHDAILAATRRWQARKKGISIPLRHRGGKKIHTTRCPLGESCKIQAKGLELLRES